MMKYAVLILICFVNTVWADSELSIQEKIDNYFWQAARTGNVKMLKEFVNVNYDLNKQDAKGYTAIILSAYHGHYDAVQYLIVSGANPCLKDKRGNSALMGAVFKGEIKIARLLMSNDCDVNDTNNAGQTPAMYAALFQRKDILKSLQDKGADLSKVDQMGNSVDNLAKGNIINQPSSNIQ